eukprot:TRINITY_DN12169_c2_g4_i2.p2 TRINITY_DN12169_c2_g4~~TRINITY_DN12169_c2_g4_i2.p2  ORF type:complete len:294 (+),score=33.72 TRINITY_DN12169_c2_g4_i2:2659-3540(+)
MPLAELQQHQEYILYSTLDLSAPLPCSRCYYELKDVLHSIFPEEYESLAGPQSMNTSHAPVPNLPIGQSVREFLQQVAPIPDYVNPAAPPPPPPAPVEQPSEPSPPSADTEQEAPVEQPMDSRSKTDAEEKARGEIDAPEQPRVEKVPRKPTSSREAAAPASARASTQSQPLAKPADAKPKENSNPKAKPPSKSTKPTPRASVWVAAGPRGAKRRSAGTSTDSAVTTTSGTKNAVASSTSCWHPLQSILRLLHLRHCPSGTRPFFSHCSVLLLCLPNCDRSPDACMWCRHDDS